MAWTFQTIRPMKELPYSDFMLIITPLLQTENYSINNRIIIGSAFR